MYDFLIGMDFVSAVAELEARGIVFDFGMQSYEEVLECESYELYIGGLWSDEHYDVEFDADGVVVSVDLWDEGWE